MKTKLLLIIGIIFSGGFVITNAYAACAGSVFGFNGPCFDVFMGSAEPMTQKSLMEDFHKHMESQHGELQIPDRQWDSYKTPIQLPAILCTEFVIDDMKQYRMAQWRDASMISSWEHHYNPLLCTKWLAPIDDGIKVTWDKELYESEDVGVVQVIDKDMNLNKQSIDSFDIHVYSDTDHTGIDLSITETGENTGIFEGTAFFTTKHESSGARLLVEDAVYADHEENRSFSRIINESRSPNIYEEHTCPPGYEYLKENCHIITDSPYTYLRILLTYPAIMLLVFGVPSLITIVVIYYIKRRQK